jgi:hypothetical protein
LSSAGALLWLATPLPAAAWLFARERDDAETLAYGGGRLVVGAVALIALLGALGGRVAVAGVALADIAIPGACAMCLADVVARRTLSRLAG